MACRPKAHKPTTYISNTYALWAHVDTMHSARTRIFTHVCVKTKIFEVYKTKKLPYKINMLRQKFNFMGQELYVEDEKTMMSLYFYFYIFYPQLGFPHIFPPKYYYLFGRDRSIVDRSSLISKVKWIVPHLRKTYPTLEFMEL